MNASQLVQSIFGTQTAPSAAPAPVAEAAPAPAPVAAPQPSFVSADQMSQMFAEFQAQMLTTVAALVDAKTAPAPAPAPQMIVVNDAPQAAPQADRGFAPAIPVNTAPFQLTEAARKRLQNERAKGANWGGWYHAEHGIYPVFTIGGKNGQTYVRFVKPSGSAPIVPVVERGKILAAPVATNDAAPLPLPNAAPAPQTIVVNDGPVNQTTTFVCRSANKRRDKRGLVACYSVQLVETGTGKLAEASSANAITQTVATLIKDRIVTPGLYSRRIELEPDRQMLWVYFHGPLGERPLFDINTPLDVAVKRIADALNATNNRPVVTG